MKILLFIMVKFSSNFSSSYRNNERTVRDDLFEIYGIPNTGTAHAFIKGGRITVPSTSCNTGFRYGRLWDYQEFFNGSWLS